MSCASASPSPIDGHSTRKGRATVPYNAPGGPEVFDSSAKTVVGSPPDAAPATQDVFFARLTRCFCRKTPTTPIIFAKGTCNRFGVIVHYNTRGAHQYIGTRKGPARNEAKGKERVMFTMVA